MFLPLFSHGQLVGKKDSQLDVATSLSGTDKVRILQGGVSKMAPYTLFSGGSSTWGGITGTLSSQTDLNNALLTKQGNISLTTTGTSGAATLVGSTLNIPNYAGGGGGGTLLTNWVTATAYTVGSFVITNQTLYENLIAHTSGTFATDLGSSRWVARLAGSLNAIAITSPATTGTINLTFDQNKDYAVFTQTGNITLTVAASPKVASTITMRIVGASTFTLTMPAGSNNLNAGVFSNSLTNLITMYMDANGNLDYTISNY